MGDPIEVAAMTQAFGADPDEPGYCRIGSVKTNIGHLDTAAGVASMIKVALTLQHREMPPSLNFERPNPNLEIEQSPFRVNDTLTPWESDGRSPRRAGVNSLGVGGTNAFAVLEEAPERPARAGQEQRQHRQRRREGRRRSGRWQGLAAGAVHAEPEPAGAAGQDRPSDRARARG